MGVEPSRRGLILLASTDSEFYRHGVAGIMIDIREKFSWWSGLLDARFQEGQGSWPAPMRAGR